jgi:hypothetical protein
MGRRRRCHSYGSSVTKVEPDLWRQVNVPGHSLRVRGRREDQRRPASRDALGDGAQDRRANRAGELRGIALRRRAGRPIAGVEHRVRRSGPSRHQRGRRTALSTGSRWRCRAVAALADTSPDKRDQDDRDEHAEADDERPPLYVVLAHRPPDLPRHPWPACRRSASAGAHGSIRSRFFGSVGAPGRPRPDANGATPIRDQICRL